MSDIHAKIVINIGTPVFPDIAEHIEDELVKFLYEKGLDATVTNDSTGNITTTSSFADRIQDEMIVEAAVGLANFRQAVGIGLQFYEMSTEIAKATGLDVDDVHYVVSQHVQDIIGQVGG